MSDPDRLAEYRAALADAKRGRAANPDRYPADFDAVAEMLDEMLGEVERLRDQLAQRDRLLARLEWADRDEYERGFCPVCGSAEATGDGHDPGCELAAALRAGSGSDASSEDAKTEPAPRP